MSAILFVLLLAFAPAHAQSTHYCGSYLGSPGTAEAEPDNLIAAMIGFWPASRAVFTHLDIKLREGFRQRGIPDALVESILAHVRDVVWAVYLVARADPSLNFRRMAWMALTHDFPEHLIPDYTPRDGISKIEKYRLEYAAFERIVETLGPDSNILMALWIEFEENITPEARWVQQLDALDATVKACHYERLGYDVSEFFDSIVTRIHHPKLIEALSHLTLRRGDPHLDYRAFYFDLLGRP